MIRYTALGDSITVGIGDRVAPGRYRGWAGIFAEALGPPGTVTFHNLASNGACTADVTRRQLPVALQQRPHLASVLVGVNDTLRGRFDLARIAEAVNTTVAALSSTGAVVLTVRLPDPARMLGVPAPLGRPLARRVRAVNAVLDAASHRWGTVHFDASSHPSTYDRRMWSADRLHPSETGHRLVAHCFAVMLRERGFPVPSLPALQPERAAPGRSAQLCWLATRGSLWLIRRLTDLVPDLVRLAAIDGWYRANGRVAELDARTDRDIAAVLATGSGQAGIAGVDTVWQRLSA